MTREAFQKELSLTREAVQTLIEVQAATGVSAWALGAALAEKAVQVIALHHGKDEALRLLDGLREVVERDG